MNAVRHCLLQLMLSLALIACMGAHPPGPAALVALPAQQYPLFDDDLDFERLIPALDESLKHLRSLPADRKYALPGGQQVSVQELMDSLDLFKQIVAVRPSPAELSEQIRRHYQLYRPSKNGAVLLTGYYQPLFEASLHRRPPYMYPLYKSPHSLVRRQNQGGQELGRWQDGVFVPFWTRSEIETQNLLQGGELVWLKDPFDAFLIHVQGSALLRCQEDGRIRSLRFAAKNGRPYASIGKYLAQSGRMRLEEVNTESIRAYLAAHPEERQQILHRNESYIFFAWSEVGPVFGSLNRPLGAGRSVAADQRIYPPGALAFLRTTRQGSDKEDAASQKTQVERFVSIQDSGSAIKGPHRLDLFCGTGEQAGLQAGMMKEKADFYVMLLKKTYQRTGPKPAELAEPAVDP